MMSRIRESFAKFMAGRYGPDRLGQFLIGVSFVLILFGLLIKKPWVDAAAFLCLVLCYIRMFSKNIHKRYEENQRFERLWSKAFGRLAGWRKRLEEKKKYHIYQCPDCGQKIRIPRGKGKISIHCPKCNHDFIRRS